MKRGNIHQTILALLITVTIMLFAVQSVAAEEAILEIAGKVISIDEEAGSFVVETEDEGTFTVIPDEDFEFSTIQVGDTVEVKGTLNEDGSISALIIKVEEQEDNDDEADQHGGYYCEQPDEQHPFGALLAERYDVDYATIQAWFCEGFGWGQIMLALQTSQITGDEAEKLLEARSNGAGWGEIWQEMGLIGKPEFAGPPSDEDGDGKPDFAGPPDDNDGDGKPDFAGPPEWVRGGRP